MRFYMVTLLICLKLLSCSSNTSDEGIDVSFHDGEIDWKKVKSAGVTFGIAQTSIGNNFEDPTFLTNWKGMTQSGVKASAYHSMVANQTGKSQVEKILDVLKPCNFSKDKDIIAIAVEEHGSENITSDKVADTLIELINELEKSSFENIVIGTAPYFWKHNVAFKKYGFGKYNLWISHHSGERFLRVPDTWKSKGYFWWRYTYFGKVDGIKSSVSRNRSNSTLQGSDILNFLESL